MDKSKQTNRERWPDLAEKVDQMRAVFGEVSVLNIYEHGSLVAGHPLPSSPEPARASKCKCGCIEPFCNCDLDDGPTYSPGVR